MISIYSFIWAFINCGIIALFIVFLRTKTNFLEKYGTFVISILSICCIFRMLIPFEFPSHQYLLDDFALYSIVMKPLLSMELPSWTPFLLMGIWLFGSMVHLIRLIRDLRKAHLSLTSHDHDADPKAYEILKEIDSSVSIPIRISPNIAVALLYGFVHPTIYLPDRTYTTEELRFILTHEYTHWKRKDVWKKLLFNLMHVISGGILLFT